MDHRETAFWLSEIVPAELGFRQVGEFTLATALLDDGRALAATCDFGGVDTGLALEADAETAVRCELMCTAPASEAEAAAVVLAAAEQLASVGGMVPAQPGIMLPGLARRARLDETDATYTVAHGLLIAPRLWGDSTPHVTEDGRMTLMLEVVLLTDEEHGIGVDQGVDKLLRRLTRRAADFEDWRRD